jgi:hypothetical protein
MAGRFAERIRAVGTRPAIYMVWPSNADFDGVSREAFRSIDRDHPEIVIFQSDDFHPTQAGS